MCILGTSWGFFMCVPRLKMASPPLGVRPRTRATSVLLRSSDAMVDSDTGEHVFALATPLLAQANERITVQVMDVSFPNTFYNVTLSNNGFSLTETVSGSTSTRALTVPAGNYDALSLKSAVLEAVNAGNGVQYSLTFSLVTGKYTFTTSHAGVTAVTLSTPAGSLRRCLGFSAGDHVFSGAPLSLVSTQVVDLLSSNHGLLIQSTFVTRTLITSKTMRPEGQLCYIPINAGNFEVIQYRDERSNTVLLDDAFVQRFSVTVTNQDGKTIDFNGGEWEVVLRFAFERDPLHDDQVLSNQRRLVSLSREMVALRKKQLERQRRVDAALESKRQDMLKKG